MLSPLPAGAALAGLGLLSHTVCVSFVIEREGALPPPYVRAFCHLSPDILCPLLTSAVPSRRLSTTVAHGRTTDLPGYCALTFTLMPGTYTPVPAVQVLDFEDNGLLIRHRRLVCAFCSSGQRFACGFLRIPPRDGHPCRPANDSPCRGHRSLSLPSECALPGAPCKSPCCNRAPGASHEVERPLVTSETAPLPGRRAPAPASPSPETPQSPCPPSAPTPALGSCT